MSERTLTMMREYRSKRRELAVLLVQLQNFTGLSETEVIESMQFSQPQEERVQTSNISDKTAQIATSFRERTRRLNEEWYEYLFEQYYDLKEELDFFDFALSQLSGQLPGIMHDLVVDQASWEQVMERYHISRKTLWRYRQKAIEELDHLYEMRDKQITSFILN